MDAPLVYPDSSCSGGWIVRPVEGSEKVELCTFSGPNACQAALEFAHAKIRAPGTSPPKPEGYDSEPFRLARARPGQSAGRASAPRRFAHKAGPGAPARPRALADAAPVNSLSSGWARFRPVPAADQR